MTIFILVICMLNAIRAATKIPSVNFHFTRKCNYSCKFCFHTSKTSVVLPVEKMKHLISLLADSGCQKINFAGGEPFLPEYRETLGSLIKFCKEECNYSSVSIISNGVYVLEPWFEKYGRFLDILGISCDSADDEINMRMGRGTGEHINHVYRAAAICKNFGIKFKLNTVVNSLNWDHDMSQLVNDVDPMRWKIFQVLPLVGENTGVASIRDVTPLLVSNKQFNHFIDINVKKLKNSMIMKVEDNTLMKTSYLIIDEFGRFLDCSMGSKTPTESILDIGVEKAYSQLVNGPGLGFDLELFIKRDGLYNKDIFGGKSDWSK